MTDELILKNYYDTVFNSKEYTEKVSLEKLIENTKKQVKSNKIKRIIFSIILIQHLRLNSYQQYHHLNMHNKQQLLS